ncbi:hypothetical protein ABLU29_00090 (plasmid) [Lactococcus lactis]|uniref:hypothetical protein n=1 Tax=Lactococcus lactis TaxID=1358 RepID=UPI0033132758
MQEGGAAVGLAITLMFGVVLMTWFVIKYGVILAWKMVVILAKIFAWATMLPGTKYAN